MKKKILIFVITLIMLLTYFTSCQYGGFQKVIDDYQKDLISALNKESSKAISKLFASSVASAPDFEYNVGLLLELLRPTVVNRENGPYGGTQGDFTNTVFKVTASGNYYAIGLLIRHRNTDDKDEIGIVSLYVTDYQYANYNGGGIDIADWVYGINFDLY